MLVKDLLPELKKWFPIKAYKKGRTLEELAMNAGEQKVIDKVAGMVKGADLSIVK